MKGLLIFTIFGLMTSILSSCKTSFIKEDQDRQRILEQKNMHSKLKFTVECYSSNPTLEELFFYYEIKNREYNALLQIHEDTNPIDLTEIRRNLVASNPKNPYIQYSFLNPWRNFIYSLPLRSNRSDYRIFNYDPYWRYRYSAPANVKPGHQF